MLTQWQYPYQGVRMSRNVVIATAIAVVVGIGAGYWLMKGERRVPVHAGEVNNPPTAAGEVNTGIRTAPGNVQTGVPGK